MKPFLQKCYHLKSPVYTYSGVFYTVSFFPDSPFFLPLCKYHNLSLFKRHNIKGNTELSILAPCIISNDTLS